MASRKLGKKIVSKKSTIRVPAGKIIFESQLEPKKRHRRSTPFQQLHKVNRDREHNKYHYLYNKLLSKENKKLYIYVKKHKSAVAKKYNAELSKVMKDYGYPLIVRRQAKNYSLVGKHVKAKLNNVVERYNKNNTKALVKGKWITIKKSKSLQKRAVKWARIEAYQDILGITKVKAKEVLQEIEKKTELSFELKALIY